jgi:two-component system nitrate/nitrite response regulator NarL
MIIVTVIEDNRLGRDGLAAQINNTADVRAFASSVSGADLALERNSPRVILLDVSLGEQECVRLTEEFTRDFPDAKLIITDLSPERHDILEFVNAGVSGFVDKDASFDDLLHTIRAVAEGGKVLPVGMTAALFSQITRDDERGERRLLVADVRITAREYEIVQRIKAGDGNKQIAATLNLSAHTVKAHVRNIMSKLTLTSRLQIAAYAHGEDRKAEEGSRGRASG